MQQQAMIKDHLNFAKDKDFLKLIDVGGNLPLKSLSFFIETLVFSGKLHKFNPMGWKQERNIVITNKSVMNLNKKCSAFTNTFDVALKRKIDIHKLAAVTKSIAKDSHEFVIHVPLEYDYRYYSEQKEEIIDILKETYQKCCNKELLLYGVPDATLKNYVTSNDDRKDNQIKIPDEKFRIKTENLLPESQIRNPVGDELPDLKSLKTTAKLLYSRKEESKSTSIAEFKVTRAENKSAYEQIYLAEHESTKLIFSLKVLRKNEVLDTDKITSDTIVTEVKKNSGCPFLSVPEFVYQGTGCLYLFFKRMMGKDLAFVLSKEKRFSERKAQFYAAQIALALAHLHTNHIIYRDLRPENVLIDETGYISLNDFGIYRFVAEDKKRPLMNATAGTYPRYQEYLPPEHFEADKEITKAIDWWSLGVIIYEMIVGVTPFYLKDVHMFRQQIKDNPVTYPDSMKFHILISDWAKDIIGRVNRI